ncbi:hypothetical protein EVG20_g11242, partial [Dentipellis fragilis]
MTLAPELSCRKSHEFEPRLRRTWYRGTQTATTNKSYIHPTSTSTYAYPASTNHEQIFGPGRNHGRRTITFSAVFSACAPAGPKPPPSASSPSSASPSHRQTSRAPSASASHSRCAAPRDRASRTRTTNSRSRSDSATTRLAPAGVPRDATEELLDARRRVGARYTIAAIASEEAEPDTKTHPTISLPLKL